MKFQVTGILEDGSTFDKEVEGPDEKTVRGYAKQNGVTINSIRAISDSKASAKFPRSSFDVTSISLLVLGSLILIVSFGNLIVGVDENNAAKLFSANYLCIAGMGCIIISSIRFVGLVIYSAIKDR